MENFPMFSRFYRAPPATDADIARWESEAGFALPGDYKLFLTKFSNGGDGFTSSNVHVILWPLEDLVALNRSYQVPEYAPGLFLFGSDGGGEAYAFDLRGPVMPVVDVPFVGLDLSLVRPIAPNFREFLDATNELIAAPAPIDSEKPSSDDRRGKEIFEIKPVILGGSPTDPANKIVLTRAQHIDAVRYWNRVVRQARQAQTARRSPP